MPSPSAHSPALTRTADALLLLALCFAPLAVGGVYAWAQLGLLLITGLATLAVVLDRQRAGRLVHAGPLAPPLLILAVLCAAQLVPLPLGMIGVISPTAGELLELILVPLGAAGAHPLSLDPPATAVELGKVLLYALLAVVATRRARSHRGRRWLWRAVALAGVAGITVAAIQTIANVARPYGVFGTPPEAFLVSTFVNPNHAAAFFGLTGFAAAAVALTQRERARAALWATAAVLLGAAVVLTLSRGGILALMASLLLFAWLLWTRGREAKRTLGWLNLGVALLVAIAVYLTYNPLVATLGTLDPRHLEGDKSFLWREAVAIAPRFFTTGIGRGAFARVFPIYKLNDHARTFDFAECGPVQLLVDLGLIAGPLLLIAVLLFYALALRRARRPAEIAALCGLVFVGLHNLVDFSLELPGVALPSVALAVSVAVTHRRRSGSGKEKEALGSWRDLRLGGIRSGLVLILVTALAAAGLSYGHRHDGRDLDAAIRRDPEPRRLEALGARGLRHHPTDYVYALAIAHGALGRGDGHRDRALRWLNRALYLNPTYAVTHREVARVLWASGHRAQALSHWRHAPALQKRLGPIVVRDLLALDAAYPELGAGLPEEGLLALCRALSAARRSEEASRCLSDRLAAAPADQEAHWDAFNQARGEERLEQAAQHAARLVELAPDRARGYLAQGRLDLQRGEPERARARWRDAVAKVRDPGALWIELFEDALHRRRYAEAREHLDAYRRVGSVSSRSALAGYLLSGRLYEVQALFAKARREYLQAHRLAPTDARPLSGLARCEERLGYLERAAERHQQILKLRPGDKGAAAALERLRARRAAQQERARWEQVIGAPEE